MSVVMFRLASIPIRCAESRVWPGPLCKTTVLVSGRQTLETNLTLGVSAAICSPSSRRMVFSCRKSSAELVWSVDEGVTAARKPAADAFSPASDSCCITADSQHSFA